MIKTDAIYLMTVFNDHGDVDSLAFFSKTKAISHIALKYPAYKPYAADHSEDVEVWMKSEKEGLLLEQVKVAQ